jgi:uncharacterized protein (TIGR03435 family)
MYRRCFLLVTFLCSAACFGQSGESRPEFDAVSVRRSEKSCVASPGRMTMTPRSLSLPCVTLRTLIALAYGAAGLDAHRMEVVGVGAALDGNRYDILARAELGGPGSAVFPMLQRLLEDRFGLRVHKEARSSPVYALTVLKTGHKLKSSQSGTCTTQESVVMVPGRSKPNEPKVRICGSPVGTGSGKLMKWDVYGITLEKFARSIVTTYAGLPVVDHSGLEGQFDIHLEFVPEMPSGLGLVNGVPTPGGSRTSDEDGPTLFLALEQQLGLRLSRSQGQVEVIVVDHVESPSPN